MRAIAGGSVTMEGSSGVPKRTPLILIWAFSTLIWSLFTPPHKTFAARVLLFQPAWLMRALIKSPTWTEDLGITLSLHAVYSYWTGAWRFLSVDDLTKLDFDDQATWVPLQLFTLLGMCALFAGSIVIRDHYLKSKEPEDPIREQRIDEQVLPPLLLTSRTTHSRMFPRKHAFSYSYLLVGVPVGVKGRISKMLSVDSERRGWFAIDSADFLNRGSGYLSLAGKLKRYLHTQGVTDRDYAFAYLVTAPRFLGYSFNPVSFWYLYDSDTKLKYMVLEVNNTFDERRMYLLKPGNNQNDFGSDLKLQPDNGAEDSSKQPVFTTSWQKDFHVSPFNSRKGSYSLRATDPLAAYEETGQVHIDNTIVLRSSKAHAKVVARVFSEGPPKDPTMISSLEATRFIAVWCWVGFATFPRIVWEASKLFFQRKLHVWYRPEVAETSIGRPYTSDETLLEAFFRAFLTNAVSEASKPLRVIYEPAHSGNTEVVLYSPGFTFEEDHKKTITVKVISPAFYSRFTHYLSAKEAFDQEGLADDEKNHTVNIEHPELLPVLLEAIEEQRNAGKQDVRLSALDQVRWTCLRRLRCLPAAAICPGDSSSLDPVYNLKDTGNSNDSELDCFVKQNCEDGDVYRRIASKIFIAQRIALGSPAVLVVLDWLVRYLLLLASMVYSDNCNAVDILRPRRLDVEDAGTFAATLLLANTVHIWSFLKG